LGPLRHRFRPNRLVPKQLAFQFLVAKPSGNGQPIPAAAAVPDYSWTVPAHPATARDLPLPQPHSNRNRRTSFVFRMDFLLAGTLFSLFMEFNAG